MSPKGPVVMLLGPSRAAVSGVSTHLNLLFGSSLARDFELIHFQVGSEGRDESAAARLLRLLVSPFALAARILADGVTIVHLNTSINRRAYWRDLAYLLVAKLCGARVVYQVHGGVLPRLFTGDNRLFAALLRATLVLPDVVVVLTQAAFAAYREFVPKQVIVALPNGIDLAPYVELVRAPAAPSAPLRMIYVGRLVRAKGLFEALQGLAQVRAQGVAASLVIAGSGPDQTPLQECVEHSGLADAVRFVGPVFNADKLALYSNADVLVFPSYSEGLPYTLLESMAAGVPAIITPVGGVPDVMADGVHGLFVPPRDAAAVGRAIIQLAGNRALLADMSTACRRRIAGGYSIERLAEEFARLYSEACTLRRTGLIGKSKSGAS
ncbi:glycosyltransferase family 4 protein [Georgfuchsia toluolica]|nr:glycosyltransferase family 4 protein [Georgfuchsia toluolica]